MQPVFTEIQTFNKWWHYALAGFPVLIIAGCTLGVWLSGITNGNSKEPFLFLILISVLLFTIAAFVWLLLLKLKTTINEQGILVKFFGMPFCKRTIAWSDIKSAHLIEYSPLSDYGGWGVRYSLSGNGWCYNVSGNTGIKIIYQNGKPFLIGTQYKEEAEAIIKHYFKN